MTTQRQTSKPRIVLISIAIIVATALVTWLIIFATRDRNPIPVDMREKLSFSPLVIPLENQSFKTTNYSLSRSEDGTQILTYTINYNDTSVTLSEYVQPPEFSEIPEYKDRFLSNIIKQQQVVQTANGAIYLSSLAPKDNSQIGVMLERGLIVLIKPDTPLQAADWRKLVENLQVQKID